MLPSGLEQWPVSAQEPGSRSQCMEVRTLTRPEHCLILGNGAVKCNTKGKIFFLSPAADQFCLEAGLPLQHNARRGTADVGLVAINSSSLFFLRKELDFTK